MSEYAGLIESGVYCKGCGCFTNKEMGKPTLCAECITNRDDVRNGLYCADCGISHDEPIGSRALCYSCEQGKWLK